MTSASKRLGRLLGILNAVVEDLTGTDPNYQLSVRANGDNPLRSTMSLPTHYPLGENELPLHFRWTVKQTANGENWAMREEGLIPSSDVSLENNLPYTTALLKLLEDLNTISIKKETCIVYAIDATLSGITGMTSLIMNLNTHFSLTNPEKRQSTN